MTLNPYEPRRAGACVYRLTVGTPVLLVTAMLTGCPLPPEKPEPPHTQTCNCACEQGDKGAARSTRSCSTDPLDEPAKPQDTDRRPSWPK